MRKGDIFHRGGDYESSLRLYNHYASKIKETADKAEILLQKYKINESDPNFPFNLIEIKNPHKIYSHQFLKPVLFSKEENFEDFRKIEYERINEDPKKEIAKIKAMTEFRRMKQMREERRFPSRGKGDTKKIEKKIKKNSKDKKLNIPIRERVKLFMKKYHRKEGNKLIESEEILEEDNFTSEEKMRKKYQQKENILWIIAKEFYLEGKRFGSSLRITKPDLKEKIERLIREKEIELSSEEMEESLSKLQSILSASLTESKMIEKEGNKKESSKDWRTINFEISKGSTPPKSHSKYKSKRSLDYEYSLEDTSKPGNETARSSIIKIEYGNL